MKNKFLLFSLSSFLLFSCSPQEVADNNGMINSPSENGGGEANEKDDLIETSGLDDLITLFNGVKNSTRFSYHTKLEATGAQDEYIDYYTPHAWYEESLTNPDGSFGYAENKNKEMFKYYIKDDKAYGSVFEWQTGNNNFEEKVTGLYSPLTIAHINLLDSVFDENSNFATNLGGNSYVITDDNIVSIFQYMTNYGSSLYGKISKAQVDIVNLETFEFKVTLYVNFSENTSGTFVSSFKKETSTPIDFVNDAVINGTLDGVEAFEGVENFFNLSLMNNYTLEGIYSIEKGQAIDRSSYKIFCTNDYFYLDYKNPSYSDWGFMFIPEKTEVTYVDEEKGSITQTLNYESCYGYSKNDKGELYFDFFKGPIETEDTHYLKVDSLPEKGDSSYLYIVEEESGTNVYEWRVDSSGNGKFFLYSQWYDTVGDFYINDASATFYLSSSALSYVGKYYFEEVIGKKDEFYTTNTTVLGALANSMFGWGFQATTTWMNYVKKANLRLKRDVANNIVEAEIGLTVLVSVDGAANSQEEIYYKMSNFNSTKVEEVENFYNKTVKGA